MNYVAKRIFVILPIVFILLSYWHDSKIYSVSFMGDVKDRYATFLNDEEDGVRLVASASIEQVGKEIVNSESNQNKKVPSSSKDAFLLAKKQEVEISINQNRNVQNSRENESVRNFTPFLFEVIIPTTEKNNKYASLNKYSYNFQEDGVSGQMSIDEVSDGEGQIKRVLSFTASLPTVDISFSKSNIFIDDKRIYYIDEEGIEYQGTKFESENGDSFSFTFQTGELAGYEFKFVNGYDVAEAEFSKRTNAVETFEQSKYANNTDFQTLDNGAMEMSQIEPDTQIQPQNFSTLQPSFTPPSPAQESFTEESSEVYTWKTYDDNGRESATFSKKLSEMKPSDWDEYSVYVDVIEAEVNGSGEQTSTQSF